MNEFVVFEKAEHWVLIIVRCLVAAKLVLRLRYAQSIKDSLQSVIYVPRPDDLAGWIGPQKKNAY